MTHTEQLQHEIDMDDQQIRVCKKRKRANQYVLDSLTKRETITYMKDKGEAL